MYGPQENKPPVFGEEEKCKVSQEAFFQDSQQNNADFDKNFFDKVINSYQTIISTEEEQKEEAPTNIDIMFEVVERAIAKLRSGKAPGPDTFPTDLFIQAGDTTRVAIRRLFSLSWKEGLLPDMWKTAEVKFLRKPGKPDYYSPNSYRPISLTSCLGKIMERIVMNRLEPYIEGNGLMDLELEGFRKKNNTPQIMQF